MLFLGYVLDYIPTAVLDGLFLYLAVTALYGNQMFERIMLFFMEQAAYPPNSYIRRVPEMKMHLFTICQIFQLGILCAFGFNPWPYAKMIFPLVILSFLPIRHKLIPKVVDKVCMLIEYLFVVELSTNTHLFIFLEIFGRFRWRWTLMKKIVQTNLLNEIKCSLYQ